MVHIELKTKLSFWIVFFLSFFTLSSALLFYFFGINDHVLILSTAFIAAVLVITTLMSVYYSYNQKVIITGDEIRIFGVPSATISYNEIKKVRVNIDGFRIYSKTQNPIFISTISSNFGEAKNLLIQKIRNRKNVVFEGSNRLIHKYFIAE